MRYSAFEQAAAEANIGLREIDNQLDQLKAQVETLKSKRDLLENLGRQLATLRPHTGDATPAEPAREAVQAAPAAEAPAAEPTQAYAAMENDPELAGTAVYNASRPLRTDNGWFHRSSNESGIRGRL